MPNLPPDLPAWLDRVEAYCAKATKGPCEGHGLDPLHCKICDQAEAEFESNSLEDLPRAVRVIRGLVEHLDWALTYGDFEEVITDNPLHRRAFGRAKAALQEARDERTF